MRVCLFTPTFFPKLGGAERAADTVLRGLQQRGHEVVALAAHSRGPMPALPYPVFRYRRPWRQNWWPELLGLPLRRVHRRFAFDVCLAFYGYPTGFAAARLKGQLGFGLVVSPRGADLYPHYREERRFRVDAARRVGYQGADRIVSVSRWITGRLHEVVGPPLPPIDEVPNGIDLEAFDRQRDAARRDPPDLPVCRPFALHLGRVTPVKRVDMAVRAVAAAAPLFRQRGWQYAIAGDGKELAAVTTLVEQLGVGDVVKLLGARTGRDKAWLLDQAAFMVSTSKEEGLPNVVVEAMAAGLPMLATDIGPHQELVGERGWGLLFGRDDPDDLVRRLREMLDADRSAWRDRALASREAFSIERMIDGYERACVAVAR